MFFERNLILFVCGMERDWERLWDNTRPEIGEGVLFNGVVYSFSVRGSSSGQSVSCYLMSLV